jgi:stage II sporulation protein D
LAITAADTSPRRPVSPSWLALALVLGCIVVALGGSCAPAAVPGPPPLQPAPPESPDPEIRIGLATGAVLATLGGAGPLSVTDPSGSHLAEIGAGEVWRVSWSGAGIVVTAPSGGSSVPAEALAVIGQSSTEPVRLNGRSYRGIVEVLRDRTGFTLVNRLGLESYLLGVVSAEMGRRSLTEQEALQAQAVVSRTYAMRNLRRWAAQGFDLYATVADQAYGGLSAETPEGTEAVMATRGQVLTYGGEPIDAFFYSTCGGRTAEGTEVFRAANRPYLRSFSDVADDGIPYCSISPRFHWREEWTGEALRGTLRRTLPATLGVSGDRIGEVRNVQVTQRTGSGRVGQLTIGLTASPVTVNGPAVRRVLRPSSGELLRSSAFDLTVTADGRRVTRLIAIGGGAGHGVGFCQWGAVGRSRAGQTHERILESYYPGTTLERRY